MLICNLKNDNNNCRKNNNTNSPIEYLDPWLVNITSLNNGDTSLAAKVYWAGRPSFSNIKVIFGKYVSMSLGVKFLLSVDHANNISGYHYCGPSTVSKGNIEIGNDVLISMDAKILSGVKIEDGAVIAAGAVVTKDVEPYSIVGGNPGKHLKYRFSKEDIAFLLDLQWWNKDKRWIEDNKDILFTKDGNIDKLKKLIFKNE
jgi:acetyltransferase-like isoleucine patch superfamily enzyme